MKNSIVALAATVLLIAVAPRGLIDIEQDDAGLSGSSSDVQPQPGQEASPEQEPNFYEEIPNNKGADEAPEVEQGENSIRAQPEAEEGGDTIGAPPGIEQSDSQYAAEFFALSPNEAVVKTYSELNSALSNDNGITTVYFGADITMQAGIKVSPKKAELTIVGLNPLEPGRTQPYTLTDLDSASFYDTIYMGEAGVSSLYIRDLVLVGKNYYGSFSVADIVGLTGLVITYHRVSYTGPQLCYNRRGTVRFVDSQAAIKGGNGLISPHQEFAEVKQLFFAGKCTIDSVSSTNAVFWLPLGGSFEIADDSSLSLISSNTSTAYGVFYADGYANKLDITLGNRAVLDMTISGTVAPELYVTIGSFIMREGAEFRLKTTKAANAAVLRMGGELVVGDGARFTIQGAGGTSQPVLRQQGGDITVGSGSVFHIVADSPYASLINLVGCGFICSDPASVLLYNAGRNIQASASAGRVYAHAQQINYWRQTAPSEFEYPPLYSWSKLDKSNFIIDAKLAVGAAGNFTEVLSNYTVGDPPGLPPNPAALDITSSQILALGRIKLAVAQPVANDGIISGVTEAGALVRATFTQGGVSYTPPDVRADPKGKFVIPTGIALEEGTVIKIKSNWQYLAAETQTTVATGGTLGIFVPDTLAFYTTQLSPFKTTVGRLERDWKITVSDTRGSVNRWSVYARLEREMITDNPHLPALKGAVVFVDDLGGIATLNTDIDTLILEHSPSASGYVLPIIWPQDKGILLAIQPGSAFAGRPYSATICWTIVDGV